MLNYREISDIVKMVDASDCEEFILELEGVKLVIRRGSTGDNNTHTASAQTPTTSASPAAGAVSAESNVTRSTPSASSSASQQTGVQAAGHELRSPMVGTFYRRPSPDKEPFVNVGDKVTSGTPLCMIEVMKLYTTIESTVDGTVTAILADDAELVQYDQRLFEFESTP